jgi:hypothetical protein
MANKDDASKDLQAPPEPNDKARLEDEQKPAVVNKEVANKDNASKDLKAPPEPNGQARKEDDRKPAAVNTKVDDATLKLKESPNPLTKKTRQTTRNRWLVCVFCNVCVHPLPDCCRFLGD